MKLPGTFVLRRAYFDEFSGSGSLTQRNICGLRLLSTWSAKDIQNWYTQKGYQEALTGVMGDGEKSPDIEAGNNRDSNVVNLSLDWSDPAQGKLL